MDSIQFSSGIGATCFTLVTNTRGPHRSKTSDIYWFLIFLLGAYDLSIILINLFCLNKIRS